MLLEESGLSFYLGSQEKVTSYEIAQNLNYIFDNPTIIKKMRKDNMELVDGKGVLRCVSEIFNNNRDI